MATLEEIKELLREETGVIVVVVVVVKFGAP